MTIFLKMRCFFWLCFFVISSAYAQTTPALNPQTTSHKPLNLDDSAIVKSMAEEMNKDNPPVTTPTLSAGPNKVDELFKKAEKAGFAPKIVEIKTAGSSERVTKVSYGNESYCVYSPSVARTDGIDSIQHGLQTQVRTCPKEAQ